MFWKISVLGILKRNKITQGLGMPVGELFFGKVAGFKPVALLENGLLGRCFLRILPKF